MPKFMKKSAYLFIYPMLIIAVIGIIKYLYINFSSILLSFSVENEYGEQVYTLVNFEKLFSEFTNSDGEIWRALINTLKYFLMYTVKNLVSFVVAYFLYKKILGYKAFRVIFYLPSIVSPIILVGVWDSMLSTGGVFSIIAEMFGNEYRNPLVNAATATNTILVFSFWVGFGTSLLMFVGAMNRVPEEILDAGLIDGCGMWKEFFKIMIPLTWETLSTMILLTTMSIFTATGPILYFTGGQNDTNTLSFWIFNSTRNGMENYPSAVGLFFTIAALPIVVGCRWLMNKVNSDITY
ncbi:MAG: sugar ABC transporter permease [Clostridiales bacterium]|nr:sugar ABC transporter permease [Clostridiales bacterium]